MSEWKECKLGEIVDVIDSLHQTPKYSNIGYPMVRVTDIKGGYLKTENTLKVDKQVFEVFSKKHKPKKGDIVMSRVGSYGISCIVKNDIDFCLGQNTLFLVPKQNPEFLYYFLNSPDAKNQIESKATGTTQKTISLKSIKEIKVCLPSIFLQTAIAEILSSLDDKIELNNKINQELETLAQTLFKQWFIDFEFPNENGEPYKSSGGEMVDSELGEIPKGWEIIQISDVLDFISGFPFKGESYSKIGKYGIVTIKNVQDGKFVQYTDNYIDELPNRLPNNAILHIGDILMSLTGNVGRVCFVTKENCVLNQRVVKFKGKQENSNAFWYYFFRQNSVKDLLISISKGTAQLNLSPVETRTLKFILPKIINEKLLAPFIEMFNIEVACSVENETLTILRDTLLPKLISGELEIHEIKN